MTQQGIMFEGDIQKRMKSMNMSYLTIVHELNK